MKILLVSFATQPDRGSEGGVGWHMLKSAFQVSQQTESELHVIIDHRDAPGVLGSIEKLDPKLARNIHTVALPLMAQNRFGKSKSRASYLAWYPMALRRAFKLHAEFNFDIAHQVTFATASLPPVLPAPIRHKVWGPVAIARQPALGINGTASLLDTATTYAAKNLGRNLSRFPDECIAQNEQTARILRKAGIKNTIEPNIIVEPGTPQETIPNSIVFSGNLVDRKRPWILLQALNHPSMRDFTATFVGDGNLRGYLESYVRLERMNSRVNFLGRVDHGTSISTIARADVHVLPSSREGAPWVVGEAAAHGVPSVVSSISGASTVVELSGDLGCVVKEKRNDEDISDGFRRAIRDTSGKTWTPSARWTERRLPTLLSDVWQLG